MSLARFLFVWVCLGSIHRLARFCLVNVVFQAEGGIRGAHEGLEFRRVLFRSRSAVAAAHPRAGPAPPSWPLAPRRHAFDAYGLRFLRAEAQFGDRKQPVDNYVTARDAIIHKPRPLALADQEQRRQFTRSPVSRKQHLGLRAIVQALDRPPEIGRSAWRERG